MPVVPEQNSGEGGAPRPLISLFCSGSGWPLVVMDAGLAGTSLDWSRVVPEVARLTQVGTFDRPGYRQTPAGRLPRTSAAVVAEVRAALDVAGCEGPYVLVGHSFGGMTMRLFAAQYPELVAGLVLVDASSHLRAQGAPRLIALLDHVELLLERILWALALTGLLRLIVRVPGLPIVRRMLRKYPQAVRRQIRSLYGSAHFWRTVYDEDRAYALSCEELRQARRPLGDLPMIVLARATLEGVAAPLLGRSADVVWHRLQEDAASDSTQSRVIYVEGSGHNIHLDRPEVVIEAIAQVVQQARRRAGRAAGTQRGMPMSQDTEQSSIGAENEDGLVLTIAYESVEEHADGAATFGLTEQRLWQVASETLTRVGITEPLEVSVLLTDDAGIRELNREYRAKDEATDVLSFPLMDAPLVDAPPEELWQPAEEDAPARPRMQMSLAGDVEFERAFADFAEPNPIDDGVAGDGSVATESAAEADVKVDDDDELPEDVMPFAEDEPLLLGDIAISLDAVARQASTAGHSPAWELAYLLSHGVLHLVGYDDHTEAGYAAMVSHQEAVLAAAAIERQ